MKQLTIIILKYGAVVLLQGVATTLDENETPPGKLITRIKLFFQLQQKN
jgi:hypothetical protein